LLTPTTRTVDGGSPCGSSAWNAHDLERILSHYADDVAMLSPLGSGLTGTDEATMVGKEALRAEDPGIFEPDRSPWVVTEAVPYERSSE
jgi:hypothetical protein